MTRTHQATLALCVILLASAACTSSSSKAAPPAKAEVPVGYRYDVPEAKKNPRVVEETDTYFVERYKKDELIRMDETHVRLPIMTAGIPFYREDADFYYIRTEKISPEEQAAMDEAARRKMEESQRVVKPVTHGTSVSAPIIAADFETLAPRRANAGVRFRRAGSGLPDRGQFRENIAVVDFDGDGHLDIVTTPPRDTSGLIALVYLGDGKGGFTGRKIDVVDARGNPVKVGIGYGGVVVADFDGDGKLDLATASHAGGVHVLLQRDNFRFQTDDGGLPRNFSSQALAAFDVDGDGRTDLVVSRDSSDLALTGKIDKQQVRVLRNEGSAGWKVVEDGLVGGYYSNHVFSFSYSGGPRPDLLAGCNYLGGTILTWKNEGDGHFVPAPFDALESYANHTAVAPGTFGPDRRPAIADFYAKFGGGRPPLKANGINIYVRNREGWAKVPIWRQKDSKGRLTVGLAMGDLDGDGLDDVVFPDPELRKLRIFYQTAQGGFQEAPEALEPALDSVVADVRIADLNGDGRNDIVLSKTVYSESPKDPGGLEVLINEGR
jgi:hypothetical protein